MQGLANIQAKVVHHDSFWGSTLEVKIDPSTGMTAQEVIEQLDNGNPRIWANSEGDDTVTFNAHTLNPGEDDIIVRRLREIIA